MTSLTQQVNSADVLDLSEPLRTSVPPFLIMAANAEPLDQLVSVTTRPTSAPTSGDLTANAPSDASTAGLETIALWSSTSPKQLMLMAFERLDVESATLRHVNSCLQAEIGDLRRENAELRRELDRTVDDRRASDERRIAVEQINEQLTTELNERRAVDIGAQELERSRQKVVELGFRVDELQRQLASERTDRERLDRELDGRQQQQQQQPQQQQLQSSRRKRNRRVSRVDENDSLLRDKERRLEMALEIDALRSERDGLRATSDRMSTACGLLEAEVTRLRAAVEERESELGRESVRHGLLTRQFNSLLNENERLKQRHRVQTSTFSSGLSASSSTSNIPAAMSTAGNSIIVGNAPSSRGFGSMAATRWSSDNAKLPRSGTWSSALSLQQEEVTTTSARETRTPSVSPHREPMTSSPIRHQQSGVASTHQAEQSSSLSQYQQQSNRASAVDTGRPSRIDGPNADNAPQPNRRSLLSRRQQQPSLTSHPSTQSHHDDASVSPPERQVSTAAKLTSGAAVAARRGNISSVTQSLGNNRTVPPAMKPTNAVTIAESNRRFDKQLPVPTMRLRTFGALTMLAAVHSEEDVRLSASSTSSTSCTSSPTGSDSSTLPDINRRSTMIVVNGSMKTPTDQTTSNKLRRPPHA